MFSRQLVASLVVVIGLFAAAPAALADKNVEIFNGKDFTGWTQRGGTATYRIEDGVIIGRSAPNTTNTFMTTDREFGDFVLELDFKIDNKDNFNSGVQIRSHSRPEREQQRVFGYQVEIDTQEDRPWTGGIYYEGGGPHRKAGWLNDLKDNEAARKARKLGDWNHLKVEAKGRRIRTWINGVPAADFTDKDERAFAPKGFIALQVHGVGGKTEPLEVRWKNLKLTELE